MLDSLEIEIQDWAERVGLLEHGTVRAQLGKLKEEVEELEVEIEKYGMSEVEQGFDSTPVELEMGDVFVSLVILAELRGLSLENCVKKTLRKIQKREKTGQMKNGAFVKQSRKGV